MSSDMLLLSLNTTLCVQTSFVGKRPRARMVTRTHRGVDKPDPVVQDHSKGSVNGYQTRQGSGHETAKTSPLIVCCWCCCHSHRDRLGSTWRMGTVRTKQPDGCNRRCAMHGFGRMAGVAYHVASDAASSRLRDTSDMALACLVGSYVRCPYALGVASGGQTSTVKASQSTPSGPSNTLLGHYVARVNKGVRTVFSLPTLPEWCCPVFNLLFKLEYIALRIPCTNLT